MAICSCRSFSRLLAFCKAGKDQRKQDSRTPRVALDLYTYGYTLLTISLSTVETGARRI